jgi:hypothetical protein
MSDTDDDPVYLSALQHWAYCPRQCGLIHLEQAFEDNIRQPEALAARDKQYQQRQALFDPEG